MHDLEENAAMVNALQRQAAVVVQKSLHEGFGLTVAEAMWKHRVVLGSAVGGIVDQIEPGKTGFLVQDATDLETFGTTLKHLLDNPEERGEIGDAAGAFVRDTLLTPSHLERWAGVLESLV
jgi:trehalose synthase